MELDAQVRGLLELGDRNGAVTAVFRSLGPHVLRYLRAVFSSPDEAADAFSTWTEHLCTGIGSWRGDGSFRSWAFRVAAHAARDIGGSAWRRRRRRLATREAVALAAEVLSISPESKERRRLAVQALRDQLPLEDRMLVALRVDHELSWEEISGALAGRRTRPRPNTLVKRYERVRVKLTRRARDKGLLG